MKRYPKPNRTWLVPVVVVLFFVTSGCTRSAVLPLCERLAQTKPSALGGVGETLYAVCAQRGISISVLSSTAAEFSGPKRQLLWLQDNYHLLVCDFNLRDSSIPRAAYTSCQTHSRQWVALLRAGQPEKLMLDGTDFCDVCRPVRMCH